MADREKYIKVLSETVKTVKELNEDAPIKISLNCIEDILELLKEQEDMGKELTDAMELVHKKNARIIELTDLLKEQETTRWKQISPAGIYECEKCGRHIISKDIECFKYCFNCGRLAK